MQTTSNGIKRLMPMLRVAVCLAAGVALLSWLLRVATGVAEVAAVGAPLRPDEALLGVVAVAAALLVLWWLVAGVLEVAGRVPGVVGDAARTASATLTPRLLRRSVGLVLGVGMAAGVTPGSSLAQAPQTREVRTVVAPSPVPDIGSADLPDPGWAPPRTGSPAPFRPPHPSSPAADPGGSAPTHRASTPTRPPHPSPPVEQGWTPSPPAVRPQPDVRLLTPAPAAEPTEPDEVVVRRGDTLWSIAARHLGPLPSDAEIAAAWPAWHDANRHVIGDDPDLLRPGQVLVPPQAVGS